ncbi:hypothetical protein E4U17_007271 [Claviceps sp. LM77 group G4]|nr:hypothetical protein E4U17_007271 [Claviceps sp. LM77 group G4]KAG6073707.1 hypothetical protein E4U16_004526 [Claviceps sp. LM84 group G4]KAG6084924.1 hypothetical protein E4U33_002609 [Claviceps sp. LM78 group G4]
MAARMTNGAGRPRPTRESVTVSLDEIDNDNPEHVQETYRELYRGMKTDWVELLSLAYGDTLTELGGYETMPTLFASSEAYIRREAGEAEGTTAQFTLRDEMFYSETVASLYEFDNEEPGVIEARTRILVVLDGFWSRIVAQPQRHEPLTMTPFDMVWRLLERQQQMAEAGEDRMTRIDRLLDLLLQEEFAGLFPMVLTKQQWVQIFLAGFELEYCKMLYLLEMQYCIIEEPVYRAA